MKEKTYAVNWTLHGLGGKTHEAGDRVVADSESDEVVALVKHGVITEAEVELSELTKAQLVEHAKENFDVDLDPKATKAELLAAIEEHAAAAEEDGEGGEAADQSEDEATEQ